MAKPLVFISHAATDSEFARAITNELAAVFQDRIQVFCASSPNAIEPGADWLFDVEAALSVARAALVVVTPTSIVRPWVWFELGATWQQGRARACRIIPVCVPEVDLATLPAPLNRLQALSLAKQADIRNLFEVLCSDLSCGDVSRLQVPRLLAALPRYDGVELSEVDVGGHYVYSGKFAGYSDAELMEVLDTKLFSPDELNWCKFRIFAAPREELIGRGKLLLYREIDATLDLPPGSAKRLLKVVADRFYLRPTFETENAIRFEKTSLAPRKGDPFAR